MRRSPRRPGSSEGRPSDEMRGTAGSNSVPEARGRSGRADPSPAGGRSRGPPAMSLSGPPPDARLWEGPAWRGPDWPCARPRPETSARSTRHEPPRGPPAARVRGRRRALRAAPSWRCTRPSRRRRPLRRPVGAVLRFFADSSRRRSWTMAIRTRCAPRSPRSLGWLDRQPPGRALSSGPRRVTISEYAAGLRRPPHAPRGDPPAELLEERVHAEFDVLATAGRVDGAVLLTGYHEPVVEVSDRQRPDYPRSRPGLAGGLHGRRMALPAASEPSGDRGWSARRSGPASRVGARPDRRLLHGSGGERHPSFPGQAARCGSARRPPMVTRTGRSDGCSSTRGGSPRNRLHACDSLVARQQNPVGARTRPQAQPVRRLLQAARWAAPREPRRSPHPGALHCDGRPPVPARGARVRAYGAPDSAARRARRVGSP